MAISPLASSSAQLRLGQRGAVLIAIFNDWPTGAALRALAEAQAQVARQFGKVALLSIIPNAQPQKGGPAPTLQPPPDVKEAAMRESAATGERIGASTIASALVILPKGVLAVMIRSFVSATTLLSRSKTPLQTFKDVASAAAWLETFPGMTLTPGLANDVERWLAEPQAAAAT